MLRKYTENKLLLYSGTIFFPTVILYIITNYLFPEKLNNLSRLNLTAELGSVIVSALLISPVIEEYIFRSIFLKKRIFKYIFFIGVPLYIIITSNYYVFVFLGVFILANLKKKKWILYIINSLIFSLVHYQFSDFKSILTILPVLSQFSIGLFLIWVVINFGIIKSILAHLLYNLIIILPLFFIIQFPDKTSRTIKKNDILFISEKTSYFGKSNISVEHEGINAKKLTIAEFYQIYGLKNKIKIPDTLQIYKYNFKIINKHKHQLDSITVKNLLIEANLSK